MSDRILISIKRAARLGWKNFYRESGLSVVAVFVLMVVIILSSSIFLINGVAESIIEEVEKKADITIDFQIPVAEEVIFQVEEDIRENFEVSNIEYVSREEAKILFIERFGDRSEVMESLEEVGNPFPASLNITARDPYIYREISEFLEDEYGDIIYNLDFYNREEVIAGIFNITETARKAGVIISIILGIVAILLVYNTIRLSIYNLREEVKIMRLVGSSNLFIQGSFIIQGIITGVIAALLSFIALFVLMILLSQSINFNIDISAYEYFRENAFTIIGLQLIVGVSLSVISSLIAISRYLKD